MASQPLHQRPLRELINDSLRLTRELVEHLDQAFHPKLRRLNRLVSPEPADPEFEATEDITVRNQASELLDAESFTEHVYRQIDDYCEAIDRAVGEAISGGSPP